MSPFRIPLLGGLFKVVTARAMVARAIRRGDLRRRRVSLPDVAIPSLVPSIARGEWGGRVLAEFDQDGFLFAIDPTDAAFFDRRARKKPRCRNRLDVVLRGGVLLLRKQHPRPRLGDGLRAWFWGALGLLFYTESAAMLRLLGFPAAPQLHEIDPASRSIYMDFIVGETLRHRVAACGSPVFDLDLDADPQLCQLSPGERVCREGRIWASVSEPDLRARLNELVAEMNRLGVVPLDFHLGNIIVGEATGLPYRVDFELSHLRGWPGWRVRVREQLEIAAGLIGPVPSGTSTPAARTE